MATGPRTAVRPTQTRRLGRRDMPWRPGVQGGPGGRAMRTREGVIPWSMGPTTTSLAPSSAVEGAAYGRVGGLDGGPLDTRDSVPVSRRQS